MVCRDYVIEIFTAEVNVILLHSCKKQDSAIGKSLADGGTVQERTRRVIYRNFMRWREESSRNGRRKCRICRITRESIAGHDGDVCEFLYGSIVHVLGAFGNGCAARLSRPARLMGFDERQVYVAVNDSTSAVVLLSLRHPCFICVAAYQCLIAVAMMGSNFRLEPSS